MRPEREKQLWMYGAMVTSRLFEQAIKGAYLEGKQPVFNMANGPIPPSWWQATHFFSRIGATSLT